MNSVYFAQVQACGATARTKPTSNEEARDHELARFSTEMLHIFSRTMPSRRK